MSRLLDHPRENSQRTVDDLYADMERRTSAAPLRKLPCRAHQCLLKPCSAQSSRQMRPLLHRAGPLSAPLTSR